MYICGIWKCHAVDSNDSDLEKYSAQIIIQKTALPSSLEFDNGLLSTLCKSTIPYHKPWGPAAFLEYGLLYILKS